MADYDNLMGRIMGDSLGYIRYFLVAHQRDGGGVGAVFPAPSRRSIPAQAEFAAEIHEKRQIWG